MKVFEIAGPVFSGPSGDFAPTTPAKELEKMAPEDELTSNADIVLSKNGEQAVRDLKLSDQEVEVLKAVALGWADPSDLGDLEQDIFDYWLDNNPEDFNPDLHGGGADPSDTILDELESWFEDAVANSPKQQALKKKQQKSAYQKNVDYDTARHAAKTKYMKKEDISRMRKLAGLNEERDDDKWSGANVTPKNKRPEVEMQFMTDPETGKWDEVYADPDELRNWWWSHEDQKAAAQTAGASAAGMDLKRRREDMRQAWLHNDIERVTHPKDRAKLEKLLARGGGRGDGWSQMSNPPRIAGEDPDLFKYAQKKNAQKYYADQRAAMDRAEASGKNWNELSRAEQEPYWEREINPRTGEPVRGGWTPDKPDLFKYAQKKNAQKRERDQKTAMDRAKKAGKNWNELSKAGQDAYRPKTPVDRARDHENR
jgi:hypothetical protein